MLIDFFDVQNELMMMFQLRRTPLHPNSFLPQGLAVHSSIPRCFIQSNHHPPIFFSCFSFFFSHHLSLFFIFHKIILAITHFIPTNNHQQSFRIHFNNHIQLSHLHLLHHQQHQLSRIILGAFQYFFTFSYQCNHLATSSNPWREQCPLLSPRTKRS